MRNKIALRIDPSELEATSPRATSAGEKRRSIRAKSLTWMFVLVLVIAPRFLLSGFSLSILNTALLAAVGAISLNLLTGYAGQVSIGNAAFLALGAWMVVLLPSGLGFVGKTLVAGAACGVAGAVIGLPALRLRGLYLSLATIAFQYIVVYGLTQYEIDKQSPGGFVLSEASFLGINLQSDQAWYAVIVGLLLLTVAVSRFLVSGKPGRAWLAIREHDIAAAAVGIEVVRYKLLVFVTSSFFLGLEGAVAASYVRSVSDQTYTLYLAISYVAMIIIGGLGSIYGSIIGALIVSLLPQLLTTIGNHAGGGGSHNFINQNLPFLEQIIYGALVLLVLYTEADGIVGIFNRTKHQLMQKMPEGRPSPQDVPE